MPRIMSPPFGLGSISYVTQRSRVTRNAIITASGVLVPMLAAVLGLLLASSGIDRLR
jgi:hypothetical protein